MGSTNQSPEYQAAEQKFLNAQTEEERIKYLEEMIKECPKHKSSENMLKNLRTRYKKLKQDFGKKSKKSKKKGIKKAYLQAVLLGLANSGKSSLLKALTHTFPKIASYGFTTSEPQLGILNHKGCNIQIIDLPPIASEHFNKGFLYESTILVVVEKIHEIKQVQESISNKKVKQIIVFNKIDLHDSNTQRKISETLKSKRYNFVLTSTITDEGIEDLKNKILNSFDIIRIYTKHPGKTKENIPIILPPNSTLKDVAEKILHGYSKKVLYAKITGPSSKFSNQKVGLKHIVKDKDIVEFFTV